ncbi:hypothetical protein Tco_0073438 [Tanacetum coccineum]
MMKTEITRNDIYDIETACFRDELDNVVEEEDGGWICFLGGNNSSGTKKYRGSNSSDGGDTGDGVKIVGEVIGSGGGIGDSTGVSVSLGGGISLGGKKFQELSMGDSGNIRDGGKTGGEMASEAKRYLDKLSEESGEMFLGEAGKSRTRLEWERMFESEMEMFYLVTKMGDRAACEDIMEPTSVSVKWLPFTNRNSDEAQTSEHGVQNLRTFAISAITNSSDIELD